MINISIGISTDANAGILRISAALINILEIAKYVIPNNIP
jgi:hypothetical protein